MKKFFFLVILLVNFGCTSNLLSEKEIPLPDVKLGGEGEGFTCTGLTWDKNEKIFYIGNCGKIRPNDKNFFATIVKMDKEGKNNLGEIQIYKLFPKMEDIQGLTIDYDNNSIWFCSFAENKIRNISKDGNDLGYIDVNRPIGITYDSRNNSLFILTNTKLLNIKKNGEIIKEILINIKGQDQIYLDEEKNIVYFTAGVNYQGKNFVYEIDLNTDKIQKRYILLDSYAVEGIWIDNDLMYILNDGYYHNAKNKKNVMNIYKI